MRYLPTIMLFLSSLGFTQDKIPDFLTADVGNEANLVWVVKSLDKDCSINAEEFRDAVDGVLIKAGIIPIETATQPFLNIHVSCFPTGTDSPLFRITTRFGRYSEKYETPIFPYEDYGTYGMGNKGEQQSAARETIERAVDDYIKVNFKND